MDFKQDISVKNLFETFYLCHVGKESLCENAVKEHTLVYIVSGEMEVNTPEKTILMKKGDSCFLRRNHKVSKVKHPAKNGESFNGLFLHLNTDFLREVLKEYKVAVPTVVKASVEKASYYKLPDHPYYHGLFESLTKYFETQEYPSKELMDIKMKEAVFILMQTRPELIPILFDFTSPWKPSIEEFMNNYYKSDLQVEEFAHYTGRSLTSFKKEFNDIFHITPNRWLIKRRLQEAKRMIEQMGVKPIDVYMQVGFKNLSHFSTAFKKEYGYPPSRLLEMVS